MVDFYDLAALAAAYGSRGVNLPEDITGDGVVDGADLERLRAAYVFGAPAEVPPEAAVEGDPEAMTGGAMTGGAMTGGALTGEEGRADVAGGGEADADAPDDLDGADDAAEGGL